MAPQWIPQNIQKRIFRYVLQQLSFFSEIDLSDLDVSLGNLDLKNVMLNPESFKIPSAFLRSGQIAKLNLNLTVSDGVVINGDGLELILVLSKGYLESNFSKDQSVFDLASSIFQNQPHQENQSDEISSDDDYSSGSNSSETKEPKSTFYSNYINKAVEIAVSKIQVNLKNILIKVIIHDNSGEMKNDTDSFFIKIDKAGWISSSEDAKNVTIEGLRIFTHDNQSSQHNFFKTKHKRITKKSKLDVVKEELDGNSSDEFNSDNDEYSQMMSSSFLPMQGDNNNAKDINDSEGNLEDDSDNYDSDEMFLSANSKISRTTLMTLNKIKESEDEENYDDSLHKSTINQFDKERLIDSIYEAATGSSTIEDSQFKLPYSSHTNFASIASGIENPKQLLFVSTIVTKFNGLLSIENVSVEVGDLKMSLKDDDNSLLDTIQSLLKQLDKIYKAGYADKKNQFKKQKNYSSLSSENSVTIGSKVDENQENFGEINDKLFSSFHLKSLQIQFDNFLDDDGSFSTDGNSSGLNITDLKFTKKNPLLIFGGISKISVSGDYDYLNFEDNQEEDIKFEYLINSSTKIPDITVLCSKIGFFKLTPEIIYLLLSKIPKLTSVAETITKLQLTIGAEKNKSALGLNSKRNPGSLESSFVFQKHVKVKSKQTANFVFQSNSFKGEFLFNSNDQYSIELYPMKFSRGVLDFKTFNISKNGLQIVSLLNFKLMLLQKPQQVHSYDQNNKDTTCATETIVQLDSVEIKSEFAILKSFIEQSLAFFDKLPSVSLTSNQKDPGTLIGRNNRKVRLSSTVFLGSNSMKMHLKINKICAKILNVNTKFGGLYGDITDIHLNLFADSSLQIALKHFQVFRVTDNNFSSISDFLGKNTTSLQQVLNISNPEDNLTPLFSLKFINNTGRGILRNVKLEYYAEWLMLFDKTENVASNFSNLEKDNKSLTKTEPSSITIKLKVVDCVIGLNPVRLNAKAQIMLDRGDLDIFVDNEIFVNSQFRNSSMLLIDDADKILNFKETRKRREWVTNKQFNNQVPSWSPVSWYLSRGFITVATINSLNLSYLKNSGYKLQKMTGADLAESDLKIDTDSWRLELCADSFHTLSQVLADLKEPIILSDEQKFFSASKVPSDVFKDFSSTMFSGDVVDEDKDTNTPNDVEIDDNLSYTENSSQTGISFVDDYYNQKAADDLLVQNLTDISDKKIKSSLKSNSFYAGTDSQGTSEKSSKSGDSSTISFHERYFDQSATNSLTVSKKITSAKKVLPFKVHFAVSKGSIFLYDGYDWQETRQAIRKAVKDVEDTAKIVPAHPISSQKPTQERTRRDSLGDFGFREFAGEEPEFVIDQRLFDSIHISLPAGADPTLLAPGINRIINTSDTSSVDSKAQIIPDKKTHYKKLKLRRSAKHKICIELVELEVDCLVHCNWDPEPLGFLLKYQEQEDSSQLLLSLDFKLQDLEIIDNVPTSTWNKFVSYMKDAGEREVGVSLITAHFESFRPIKNLAATDNMMKVQVLPLRLHVDQDALEFLTRFGGFKDKRFLFDPKYDELFYLSRFEVNSVHIKLDYKPKKVDYFGIRSGNTTEFMNFFILDGANILLKKVILYGVEGMPKLNDALNSLWMPDIRSTQLKGIISGLAPTLSKLSGGIKNLVVVPVKEYKKDGRLVNSIHKGAYAFVRTTTNELLRFGVKLAAGTQTILENTEEVLGGTGANARSAPQKSQIGGYAHDVEGIKDDYFDRMKSKSKKRVTDVNSPSLMLDEEPRKKKSSASSTINLGGNSGRYYSGVFTDSEDDESVGSDNVSDNGEAFDDFDEQKVISLYANQPNSAKSGISSAVKSFEKNFIIAKDTMVEAGALAAESGSAKKAAFVVAKAAPVAIIRPIIGATEAVSKTLLGVSNQMNPQLLKEAEEKYKNS